MCWPDSSSISSPVDRGESFSALKLHRALRHSTASQVRQIPHSRIAKNTHGGDAIVRAAVRVVGALPGVVEALGLGGGRRGDQGGSDGQHGEEGGLGELHRGWDWGGWRSSGVVGWVGG